MSKIEFTIENEADKAAVKHDEAVIEADKAAKGEISFTIEDAPNSNQIESPAETSIKMVKVATWLWAARIYNTIALALDSISKRQVLYNSEVAKPNTIIELFGTITILRDNQPFRELKILELLTRRNKNPKQSPELYEEISFRPRHKKSNLFRKQRQASKFIPNNNYNPEDSQFNRSQNGNVEASQYGKGRNFNDAQRNSYEEHYIAQCQEFYNKKEKEVELEEEEF